MKRKILVLLTTLTLLISCVGLLAGCEKAKPPYSVRLDIYQPNGELVETEQYSSYTARLSLKYDGNPQVFDFKVYNKDLKKYLVDDDIDNGNLNSKIRVSVRHGESTESFPINFKDATTWPIKQGYYVIIIKFNMPIGVGPALDENYSVDTKIIKLTIEEEVI